MNDKLKPWVDLRIQTVEAKPTDNSIELQLAHKLAADMILRLLNKKDQSA
jgi:hypothetical protein